MGAFFTNHHVRTDSPERVIEVLRGVIIEPAFVSDSVGGWVSVFCEETESQAEEPLQRIGEHLSRELKTPVFAFLVHDSDIFCYWLYEQGVLRDEYNSCPDYFDGMRDDLDEQRDTATKVEYRKRVKGRSEAVLPHCKPNVNILDVEQVIHPSEPAAAEEPNNMLSPGGLSTQAIATFAQLLKTTPEIFRQQLDSHTRRRYLFVEEQAADFGTLLGLSDDGRVTLGYRYIGDGEADIPCTQIGTEAFSQEYLNRKLWAIECIHQPEVMRGWIAKGADPNARDHSERPILFHKAESCLADEVQVLIEAGADVNAETAQGREYSWERGVTPLMAAASAWQLYPGGAHSVRQEETVRHLTGAGADVNAHSEDGRTALKAAMGMIHPARAFTGKPLQPGQESLGERIAAMLRVAGAME